MNRLHVLTALALFGACSDSSSSPGGTDGAVGRADASGANDAAVLPDGGASLVDGAQGSEAGSGGSGAVRLPPVNAGFDYQIGGAYTPPAGVQIVSRDREAAPAAGLYNICYVNGFQAQPEEAAFWLNTQPDLVLRDQNKQPVIDPDWDEMLLDIGTDAKRARLAQIVGGWIEQCARDGFDAVEIDNLDSFSRSGGRLTRAHAVTFVRLLADGAHAAGLAIAQKNGAELVDSKAAMATDFVVAEECNAWDECDVYQRAYGDHVLVIEYKRDAFEAGCSAFPGLSIVLRDVPVSPAGEPGHVYDGC